MLNISSRGKKKTHVSPKFHQKRYPVYTLDSSVSRIGKMFGNLPLGICFSARNFGLQTESKRRQLVRTRTNKTKKNLKHQIISNCPYRYAIEGMVIKLWLWLKIEMISKMIKGQSKDMQLQILCEWRQPSGFTRKVPVKDFLDPKKYWYHYGIWCMSLK